MGRNNHRKDSSRSRFFKNPFKIKKIPLKAVNGTIGERVVSELFPELKFVNLSGIDFKFGKYNVEVKTSIPKKPQPEKVLLKVIGNQWVNSSATVVLIVTEKKLYYCSAESLRAYLEKKAHLLYRMPGKKGNPTDFVALPVLQAIKDKLFTGEDIAHLKTRGHSFKEIFDKVLPDFEKRKENLRKMRETLSLSHKREKDKEKRAIAREKEKQKILSHRKNGQPQGVPINGSQTMLRKKPFVRIQQPSAMRPRRK